MSLPIQKNPDLLVTQWKAILDPVVANTIVLGNQLTAISLSTTATTVPHNLGRVQQGWFVTDINAAATIFRSGKFNSSNMVLTASAVCVANIWVF